MANGRAKTWTKALFVAVCLATGCKDDAAGGSPTGGVVESLDMGFAERPDGVTGDGAAAVVVALAGEAKIRGSKGQEFVALPGHPLTGDDVVKAPEGAFVLILLRNGHLVRVDPDRLFVVVSDFELTHPSPATRSIPEQISDVMSGDERKQAGDDFAAKVAGYQKTLTGGNKPPPAVAVPEISDTPPVASPEETKADKPEKTAEPATDTGEQPEVKDPPEDTKKQPKEPKKTKKKATSDKPEKAEKPEKTEPADKPKKAGPITWSIHSGGDKTPKGPLPAVLRNQQSLLRAIVADAVKAHPNLPSTVRVVMQIKESTIKKVAIDGVHPTPEKLKSGFVGKPISEIAGPVWIVVKVPQ